jgi:hypothetical protein
MKSKKVSELNNFQSKVEGYRNMPADTNIKVPSLKIIANEGRQLDVEFEDYKASLTQTTPSSLTEEASHLSLQKVLDEAKLITTIRSGVIPLWGVVCVGVDEAWVSGKEQSIKRLDKHGSEQDIVTTTCKTWPNDITVTREGDLVYSDYDNRIVNIFRHGKIKKLITTPRGWKPDKLLYKVRGLPG